MPDAISIEGLKEFNRGLKDMDRDLPKMVRKTLNEAVQIVLKPAQRRVPKRGGGARRSMKPKSTRLLARITAGGRRAPYYAWLDFGGAVGRNRSVRRTFKRKGRYLYKEYFKARDSGEFQEEMEDRLTDLARRAGLVVERG